MKRNKIIGNLFLSIGFLVLFYKDSGFYSFGGYVDKSWENIIVSSILFVFGILIVKKNKTIK